MVRSLQLAPLHLVQIATPCFSDMVRSAVARNRNQPGLQSIGIVQLVKVSERPVKSFLNQVVNGSRVPDFPADNESHPVIKSAHDLGVSMDLSIKHRLNEFTRVAGQFRVSGAWVTAAPFWPDRGISVTVTRKPGDVVIDGCRMAYVKKFVRKSRTKPESAIYFT